MFDALFWFGIGLLVGWNFLPQPVWVASLMEYVNAPIKAGIEKVVGLFKSKPSDPPAPPTA